MLVNLIESVYRLLWGDLFTIPLGGGIGISFMVVLLFTAGIWFPSFAGAAVPGYDRRRVREKAGQGRPFLLPDAGHFHRHPRGHGQSGGRGGRCFCRRCRCGVLDVGHCHSGCVHLLYRIHPCPEIPPARPAVRRLARRTGLLSARAGGAQARQKAQTLCGSGAVCGVWPHLLVRHQSGDLQLGQFCV